VTVVQLARLIAGPDLTHQLNESARSSATSYLWCIASAVRQLQ